jgi:hypothetical protein
MAKLGIRSKGGKRTVVLWHVKQQQGTTTRHYAMRSDNTLLGRTAYPSESGHWTRVRTKVTPEQAEALRASFHTTGFEEVALERW